jgi:hypothetical protein
MKASASSAALRIAVVIAAAGMGLALSGAIVVARAAARGFVALVERRLGKEPEA